MTRTAVPAVRPVAKNLAIVTGQWPGFATGSYRDVLRITISKR